MSTNLTCHATCFELSLTTRTATETRTYVYDTFGEHIRITVGAFHTDARSDADDRLWDITLDAASMRYGYDSNGNRIWAYDKATALNTSSSYDFENRLIARGTCQYTYAPNGERMSSACSAPTYYRYDSVAEGGLSDAVAEYDSTGARQARYTHGPGADEPVGLLRSGSHYTYQKDGLGSVSKITDASQNAVNAYTYSPWGDTSSSGSLPNPYRYTGREADSGSQLYHYRARVYDPEARRFIQKDPATRADGPNLYAYAGNSPTNLVDPSGMASGWAQRVCVRGWWWTECWLFWRISLTEAETANFIYWYATAPSVALGVIATYCIFATGGLCAVIMPVLGPAIFGLGVTAAWLSFIDYLGGWKGLYLQGVVRNGVPVYTVIWHN